MYLPFTGGSSSSSLYTAFQGNIRDIESAIIANNGLGDNRFLVFVSKSAELAHLINFSYEDNKVLKDTLEIYHSPDLTSAYGISSILTKAKLVAPANDYAMIVGCHGEGWIPATPSTPKSTRFFGSGTVGYQTDIATFAEAIEMSDMHLQFLLFDVCYMSCIETSYDLRNVTDYIIGSTSEVMDYGMPYKSIFPLLLKKEPDYEQVTREYLKFYSSYNYPYGTIGVTKCQYVDEMAMLMREINAHYTIDENAISTVQDLDAGRYTPNVYFDFGDYVEKMLALSEGEDDNYKVSLLEKYRNTLALLVPYKATTGKILAGVDRSVIKVNNFSGLTISDPSTNKVAVQSKKTTSWWFITH